MSEWLRYLIANQGTLVRIQSLPQDELNMDPDIQKFFDTPTPKYINEYVDEMFRILGTKESPELICTLAPEEIFVFGSNLAGIHGAGAAKLAKNKWGAEEGVGEGITGQCYALPTKDFRIQTLSLKRIQHSVNQFIRKVELMPENTFLVTEVGCGLAGYHPEEMAPLFYKCVGIPNIRLPRRFINALVDNLDKEEFRIRFGE